MMMVALVAMVGVGSGGTLQDCGFSPQNGVKQISSKKCHLRKVICKKTTLLGICLFKKKANQ